MLARLGLIIGLLIPNFGYSDTVVKYGVALPKDGEKLGNIKTLHVAYQDKLLSIFTQQYEIGFWTDNTSVKRSSSMIGSASYGLTVNAGYVFLQALSGPALISNTDSQLGSHLR